jgi:hypothetical protein
MLILRIKRSHITSWGLVLFLTPLIVQAVPDQSVDLDIAPFARRCCVEDRHVSQVTYDYPEAERARSQAERAVNGRYVYGLQWAEQRDVREVRVRFMPGAASDKASIEYWSRFWPDQPPDSSPLLDPDEDPWQGAWLTASAKISCAGSECSYTFHPLEESENPRAKNLPGLDYRRTLKMRLVFASKPALAGVGVFTGSVLKPVQIRIELGAGERDRHEWSGGLKVYNGHLKGIKLWKGLAGDSTGGQHFRIITGGPPKGVLLDLDVATPSLPGSEDITIVTIEAGERTFSFAVPDLDKGPIYVPVFHAYVSLASDARTFSPAMVKAGAKIREQIPQESEQTYERASMEIPPLNPELLFLPLAVEASWQKFAVEWGGGIFISKNGMRARGAGELDRLEWQGDRISWRIETGAAPSFHHGWKDTKLSLLEDDNAVAIAKWTGEGITYTEESLATLISGPLSPDDPGRSEETPSVLMAKLSAYNPESRPALAHLWLATDPDEEVTYENGELLAEGGHLVRAHLKVPAPARATPCAVPYAGQTLHGIHVELPLGAKERRSVFVAIPFVPRLSAFERARLTELDYEAEHTRVVNYWRGTLARAVPFNIPEEAFMRLAKALVLHILMSVTKHPSSGLYIVPAGTLNWGLSSNEGATQCLALDTLGFHRRSAEYLETWIRLQGANPLPGTFSKQLGVYNVGESDTGWPPNPVGQYRSPGYSLNHGYVLRTLAEHYLFTRDQEWLSHVMPSVIRAADWIVEQRKLTEVFDENERVPEYGLLPAGRLEDPPNWGHWFGANAEAVAGMTKLAQALADIKAPEAAHYADEAAAYRQDLREAVFRASSLAAVVRLRDGTYVPYVPTRPYLRIRHFGPIRPEYYSRYQKKFDQFYLYS